MLVKGAPKRLAVDVTVNYINGLLQLCGISSVLAMEILQWCVSHLIMKLAIEIYMF